MNLTTRNVAKGNTVSGGEVNMMSNTRVWLVFRTDSHHNNTRQGKREDKNIKKIIKDIKINKKVY